MAKKIIILCGFIAIFALSAVMIFHMQKKAGSAEVQERQEIADSTHSAETSDAMHEYSVTDLSNVCQENDKIFCAVERTVKCTMAPEMEGCDKNSVPSFVLGKTDEAERPTHISFKIVKIKPIPESSDISVYTESDCDALWFGLCKGTVVYSLSSTEDGWRVNNIFALE